MSVERVTLHASDPRRYRRNLRHALYISLTLIAFVAGIELIVSGFSAAGEGPMTTIIAATSNPFSAFFIGVIATAIMQSSSTTTTIVVALVASSSLPLTSGVAVVMGANLGTTITANIISLGFFTDKKELKRAVSASAYHYLFNFYTVLILFPLEFYNRSLSRWAAGIAALLPSQKKDEVPDIGNRSFIDPISDFFQYGGYGVPIFVGLVLVFISVLLFRRLISSLLEAESPEAFSKFFFKSRFKSLWWGAITTAAIRSSSITTSVAVPIVAKKIASLRQASPFILGANLGTTITAFLAAFFSQSTNAALSLALSHFLFNLIGVLIFFPFAATENLIVVSAKSVGRLCAKHKFMILAIILASYFFIPFLIIYLSL